VIDPPAPAPPIDTPATAGRRIDQIRLRNPAMRIVLANGIFDLLHVGHLRYLQAARRLGGYLVVAVNDDRSARRLRGAGRPLMTGHDRARLITAIRGIDAVLLFGTSTVAPVLRRLRPDIHCKGTDYTSRTVPERDVVRAYGGSIRIAGDRKRHASSHLLGSIARRRPRGRHPRDS
jgi:rfaE bifunctional protein nucleotidyltransferase chain/domain